MSKLDGVFGKHSGVREVGSLSSECVAGGGQVCSALLLSLGGGEAATGRGRQADGRPPSPLNVGDSEKPWGLC